MAADWDEMICYILKDLSYSIGDELINAHSFCRDDLVIAFVLLERSLPAKSAIHILAVFPSLRTLEFSSSLLYVDFF